MRPQDLLDFGGTNWREIGFFQFFRFLLWFLSPLFNFQLFLAQRKACNLLSLSNTIQELGCFLKVRYAIAIDRAMKEGVFHFLLETGKCDRMR